MRGTVRRCGGWARRIGMHPRLLLAFKTALAASIAWLLAPLIPFTDAHYSYYAPLGALIGMYPTVLGSVRAGAQKLLGLALGAGLAFGVLALGGPRVVGVALVVGVGVCFGGARYLGKGADWVPITALFVLLIGGANADQYSSNYLIHVLLGFLVGTIINVLVVPPLYLRDATTQLDRLRTMVAERLRGLAEAFSEEDATARDWSRSVAVMDNTAQRVRNAVLQANESRKGNPRGRRSGNQVSEHYQRMRALEHAVFFVRDLIDVLGGFAAEEDRGSPGQDLVKGQLGTAMIAVAELVDCDIQADKAADCLAEAENAVETLEHRLEDRTDGYPGNTAADVVAATTYLRRIIDACRPLIQS